MTPAPARGPVHDPFTCATFAALTAISLSLAQHGIPVAPVTLAAVLLKALGIVSVNGNVNFASSN